MELQGLGKLIVILGISLVVIGLLITLAPKIPVLGKLPGDFYFRRGNASIYIPLATSLLASLIISIILSVISRGR